MMKLNEPFIFSNGVSMPAIGFGTWQIPRGEVCYNAVKQAIECGYRHIDTALAYGNEKSVGEAVRDSGLAREQVFVTSKVPAEYKSYDEALRCFDKTMHNLGLDYVDLYLIHAPWPWNNIGADFTKENIEVWRAMEVIYRSGRSRAIGVSNFSITDLNAIMDNGTIVPMANQIRMFIGHAQHDLTAFCRQHNIVVEGYSPMATGRLLNNETIAAMAHSYNKSIAQLCIRYVFQKGAAPLPKSVTPERIAQNLDVDFEISAQDMAYLDGLKGTDA
jgi:diketogulonate reductase-like aldo/keto reductase